MPKHKQKTEIVYCTKCKGAVIYEVPETFPKSPKVWCNKCRYQFHITSQLKKLGLIGKKSNIRQTKKSNFDPPKITPTPERENMSPSPILAAMTDNELARQRIRMILTNPATTNREVLDAVGKIVNYMDKAGTINIEEQSEKEVLTKFRSQSTQELVSSLKESSQSEL